VLKCFECDPGPTGACKRCRDSKLRCSLTPRHVETGKANRKLLSAETVFEYRLEQLKVKPKPMAAATRGKKQRRRHQEEPQPEASGSGPLASASNVPGMTLGSASSKDDSPAFEPASGKNAQVSLPAALSPVKDSLSCVKPRPRIVAPPFQEPSPQSSDDGQSLTARVTALERRLDQSSDDGQSLTARITALEESLDQFEKWITRKLNGTGL
jgi:hypothetical protein